MCRKKGQKGKRKNTPKEVGANSPLGEMLNRWEKEDILKGLNKIKMIKYCTEIWAMESISEGPVYWPWYGCKEKWLCLALNKHVSLKEVPDEEAAKYASCWLEKVETEKSV